MDGIETRRRSTEAVPPGATQRPILTSAPAGTLRQSLRRTHLQIATRHLADVVVTAPAGRIDHQSAGDFEAALMPLVADAAARRGALVLDFSAVDYISSVGLRVLMVAARQMREREAQLVVAALGGVVAEIFAISRFDRVLAVTATVDDALARCRAAAQAAQRGPAPPA